MKTIKNKANSYKGIFSFCLLLFFLLVTTASNISPLLSGVQSTEKTHNPKFHKSYSSASAEESKFDNLSAEDADDIEIAFYGSYSINKKTIFFPKDHYCLQSAVYSSIYKIPLYDLYCNWKFDLS